MRHRGAEEEPGSPSALLRAVPAGRWGFLRKSQSGGVSPELGFVSLGITLGSRQGIAATQERGLGEGDEHKPPFSAKFG